VSELKGIARQGNKRDSEALVAAACRLVGSGQGVRSVRVLLPSRPTFAELRCYLEWAHDQHVCLRVDGTGVVMVRPERDARG
jgi:hypothetical protein